MFRRVAVGVFCVLMALTSLVGTAQGEPVVEARPKTTLLSVNLFGPFVGIYMGSFETLISSHVTVYVAPMYLNLKMTLLGSLIPADSHFWGLGAAAGVNVYFGEPLAGFFAGGGGSFNLVNLGDASANLSIVTLGIQAQVGYRWILWGWLAVAPQLNLGYTFALAALGEEGAQAAGFQTTPVLGFAIVF